MLSLRSGWWLTVASCVAGCSPPPAKQTQPSPSGVVVTVATSSGDVDVAPAGSSQLCVDDAPDPDGARKRPKRTPLKRTVPSQNKRIGNVVCRAHREVWFDDTGRMRVCTVANPVTIDGIDIAADAYTHFHPNGRPHQTRLARPQLLATAAGTAIPCAAAAVVLSKAGSLEHCQLAKPITIGKVTCRGGQNVAFHPGGQLRGATVGHPYRGLSTTFPAGTRLHWHAGGALAGGWLGRPMKIRGHSIRYEFGVHPNGRLARFDLAAAETIQGHTFPERATIRLRSNGTLASAEYESDSGFMPHGEPWTDTKHLRFDCAGKLVSEHVEHYQAPAHRGHGPP